MVRRSLDSFLLWTPKYAVLGIVFLMTGMLVTMAGGREERRKRIGLEIFPRIVALDLDLESKTKRNNGFFLAIAYLEDENTAEKLAGDLRQKIDSIGGHTVEVILLNIKEVPGKDIPTPIAIFMAEHLTEDMIKRGLAIYTRKGVLIFSPFSADLARGAHASVNITATVKPYLNLGALRRSGINLNRSLIAIAKKYE